MRTFILTHVSKDFTPGIFPTRRIHLACVYARHDSVAPAAVFIQWLGPKSKEAWAEIDEMWRGKTKLAEVVRAEIAAAKNKPKS
ncbi:MAG: hypothetical protein LAN18_12540 [Acidobacteriia bacterium]|nr:hypothetical protein [Terriglobia bacterium]